MAAKGVSSATRKRSDHEVEVSTIPIGNKGLPSGGPWSANHAIILAALHGLLSWLYVAYYVATRWGQVKFF
jgi:hypothetical protein